MKHSTLSQFLLDQKLSNLNIDNDLCKLIESLAQACVRISYRVRQGALGGILGSHGTENIQGEVQQKLDLISNQIIVEGTQWCGAVAAMASEEEEQIIPIPGEYRRGNYLLLFDPLDGSSNIDVNVSIGTIFSVLEKKSDHEQPQEADFLQSGHNQVAAGYVVYGPQTLLVITLGNGVYSFTLESNTSTWTLTHENIQIPETTSEFAINMSNMRYWHQPVKQYIQDCLSGVDGPLKKNYNMCWIASMVADVHRIITRGGVFMYPADKRESVTKGKLRLMYEANPMGFVIEQAGGLATNGKNRILDISPQQLHQRTGVILGSKKEVELITSYHTS